VVDKKLDKLLDDYRDAEKRVADFSNLLDSIEHVEDKKKLLWCEIYQNAVTDREHAAILFTDAFKQMQAGTIEHVTLGPTLAKYLERMCKSNEQLIRLVDLIAKNEERASRVNPDDIFSKIQEQ
jgi:hypothetical protein